jgi:hypothetical protein
MTEMSSSITESGFAEVLIAPHEAPVLLDMLKNRIRRLSHLEKAGPDVFAEVSRLARICFVLCSGKPGDRVTVKRMSREDVDAVYVLDHGPRTKNLLKALNDVRQKVRQTGPVDLDVSDQAAKSIIEVMES